MKLAVAVIVLADRHRRFRRRIRRDRQDRNHQAAQCRACLPGAGQGLFHRRGPDGGARLFRCRPADRRRGGFGRHRFRRHRADRRPLQPRRPGRVAGHRRAAREVPGYHDAGLVRLRPRLCCRADRGEGHRRPNGRPDPDRRRPRITRSGSPPRNTGSASRTCGFCRCSRFPTSSLRSRAAGPILRRSP